MNITENYPKYALSGRMEIHPCVLQDIGPLGPLPCSHSTSSVNHSKQGIGYRWPCAILGWLVRFWTQDELFSVVFSLVYLEVCAFSEAFSANRAFMGWFSMDCFMMCQEKFVWKLPCANLALARAFLLVCCSMNSKGWTTRKRFSTYVTFKWCFAAVNHTVRFDLRFCEELHTAMFTTLSFFTCMNFLMPCQVLFSRKFFVTCITFESFFRVAVVYLHMISEPRQWYELFATFCTFVRFAFFVWFFMPQEIRPSWKCFVAFFAFMNLIRLVHKHMLSEL